MATIKELADDGPDGTRLGKSSASLVAFYGATPVDQPAAVASAAAVTVTEAHTAVNLVIARLRELGLIAT